MLLCPSGVNRSPLLTVAAGLVAAAGVSAWLSAVPTLSAAVPSAEVPAADARTEELRNDAFRRAGARLTTSTAPIVANDDAVDGDALSCTFVSEPPSGTTPKFDCVLAGGVVVKVKYGRNPEIHAEVAATRLLTALGFAADRVTIVQRVRCHGCPRYPFFTMQVLTLLRKPDLLAPHGYAGRHTDFDAVSVEHRFPAPSIETATLKGWPWWELKRSEASKADLDEFRLLAVFLMHWDNKAENQRLVCLDEPWAGENEPCARPLLMMQDLGASFGPIKVNLETWRSTPVWSDRATCTVSMRALPFQGATFPDARISEEGRAQLARSLSALTRADIETMFTEARFPEFYSSTDDTEDLQAWTAAFKHRTDQIVNAGPCPPVTTTDNRQPTTTS